MKARIIRHLKGHSNVVTSIDFHKDGTLLASGSYDKNVMLWNLADPEDTLCFVGHHDYVLDVCFSKEDWCLASGSQDKTIRLWLLRNKDECLEFRAHQDAVRALRFCWRGDRLASASDDGVVKLWSVGCGRLLRSARVHEAAVNCVAVSADDRLLATGSEDGSIQLCALESGSCVRRLTDLGSVALHVEFHPRDPCLGGAFEDGTVRMFDLRGAAAAGPSLPTPPPPLQSHRCHRSGCTSLSFHPAGRHLLTSGDDGVIQILNIASGRRAETLSGHEGAITRARFAPPAAGDDLFASAGANRQVVLWRMDENSAGTEGASRPSARGDGAGPPPARLEIRSLAFQGHAEGAAALG